MSGSAKDFESYAVVRSVIAPAVLGVTNAGTASVDMGMSRQGWLIIDLVVGTDIPTDVVLQHSSDNVTFTNLYAVPDADVAASDLVHYNLPNMQRFVRLTWTRALANADTLWAVHVIGDLMIRAPIGT